MHHSSGLCTPSDPNLMNARWKHLIILDPRTRLRPSLSLRPMASNSPSPPLSHTRAKNKERGGPQSDRRPPTPGYGPNCRAQHVGEGGPCSPLSFIYHLLQKISSHDQQYSSPNLPHSVLYWRLILPETEFPVTNGQPFSFIPPLHRQRRSNPGPLPWRAFINPTCVLPNSKRVPIRYPARCGRFPVNSG